MSWRLILTYYKKRYTYEKISDIVSFRYSCYLM